MTNFNGRRTVRMRNKQNNCSNNRLMCVCEWALFKFTTHAAFGTAQLSYAHWPCLQHQHHHHPWYSEQYPKIARKPPTPWTHIVLSVWRLPLLNNKLYFAAFKSNFLTFFNLNGNAWNGKHAHHHKYPQAQAHTVPGTGTATFISLWLHLKKSLKGCLKNI